jgi:nucleoside-diphosphate-sugar epimerase
VLRAKTIGVPPTSIVTGGAGFLGSHLVDALVREGHRVIVVDDLSTGHVANLADTLTSEAVTLMYGDVVDVAGALDEALRALKSPRIDYIYHLASPASPDACSARPWATLRVNSAGTMSMIEIAVEHGATFVYASTSEVYGNPLVHPQPETYFGNVDPIGPRACYDEGKRFGEAAVSVAATTLGLNARIVRLFNIYGPRMDVHDGRLVPALLTAAVEGKPMPVHGSGNQTRSMTYVSDAVAGILTVVASHDSWHPVNVGSDEELTITKVAIAVAAASHTPLEIAHVEARAGDPQRSCPDVAVLRALGWEPKINFAQGIRKTCDWFLHDRMSVA